MADLLTTNELIERVREQTRNLTFNGRVDAKLSERTVRYYVTMKYVSPPERHGGRSMWRHHHVRELVRIRRAQSAGQKLSEIGQQAHHNETAPWKSANAPRITTEYLALKSMQATTDELTSVLKSTRPLVNQTKHAGWSVALAPNVFLSGFTDRRPSTTEIQRVVDALRELLPDMKQKEEME